MNRLYYAAPHGCLYYVPTSHHKSAHAHQSLLYLDYDYVFTSRTSPISHHFGDKQVHDECTDLVIPSTRLRVYTVCSSCSMFSLRKPHSPLTINEEWGFLWVSMHAFTHYTTRIYWPAKLTNLSSPSGCVWTSMSCSIMRTFWITVLWFLPVLSW